MTPADELVVAQLVDEPAKCLHLLRKHRPLNNWCKGCYGPSTPEDPCEPYRLARLAAMRMEDADDRRLAI